MWIKILHVHMCVLLYYNIAVWLYLLYEHSFVVYLTRVSLSRIQSFWNESTIWYTMDLIFINPFQTVMARCVTSDLGLHRWMESYGPYKNLQTISTRVQLGRLFAIVLFFPSCCLCQCAVFASVLFLPVCCFVDAQNQWVIVSE